MAIRFAAPCRAIASMPLGPHVNFLGHRVDPGLASGWQAAWTSPTPDHGGLRTRDAPVPAHEGEYEFGGGLFGGKGGQAVHGLVLDLAGLFVSPLAFDAKRHRAMGQRGLVGVVGEVEHPGASLLDASTDYAELTDGKVYGDVVTCPLHGAEFCLRTGEALTPPAYEPVQTFPVRIQQGTRPGPRPPLRLTLSAPSALRHPAGREGGPRGKRYAARRGCPPGERAAPGRARGR